MKKIFAFLTIIIYVIINVSCSKDDDAFATMEAYYQESLQLSSVTLDSIENFRIKVENYAVKYPEAIEHYRYLQIKKNIKTASLKITININEEWDGEELITF